MTTKDNRIEGPGMERYPPLIAAANAVRWSISIMAVYRFAAAFVISLGGWPALAQPQYIAAPDPGRTDPFTLVSHTASPTIWMGGGSEPDHDYPSLLTNYGPALAASGARVLKIYEADLVYGNPAEIRRILEFCRENGLKLAAEGHLVSAFSPSEISEGELPPGEVETLVRRLRNLNGQLDYFESDETLFRAHTVYKHPITDVAANAARNAQTLRAAFPDIKIADIEPFPQDMGELRMFLRAFAEDAHHPFDIYNPDIAWNSEYGYTTWLEKLAELSNFVHSMQMHLAVIYNGNDRASENSVAWITLAEQRIATVESDSSIDVTDAIIQTWAKFPTKVGPATEPGTMLNLTTVYSCLVRLYRSGYLRSHSATAARIEAPASVKLAPTGGASLSAVRIGESGGRSAERRVAVVLIAGSGSLEGDYPASIPTLVRTPRIKAIAGTIREVDMALGRLAISAANAGATLDIEVFGSKGNLARKTVLMEK